MMLFRPFSLWLLLSMCCTPATVPAVPAISAASPLSARYLEQARSRGLGPEGRLIVVSVADQRLALLAPETPTRLFPVSTSKWGVGSWQDSNRTPLGWHRVTDWIGAQARPGQAFVSREPTHEILPPAQWRSVLAADYVLTRILWLDGIEAGLNRGAGIDSRSRYIYLHGTNQEHLLGQPASHGCIRLANRDVMELFDLTLGRQTYCWITEAPLAFE
jgi:lipoprotein-anchoring transpeptidase ErfK/SrfK